MNDTLSASVSTFSVNSLDCWFLMMSSALAPESTLVYKSTKEFFVSSSNLLVHNSIDFNLLLKMIYA